MNDRPAASIALHVVLGDHPRVGHDDHVVQTVGGHERLDRGQHGRRFGLVALERVDHEREPRRVGE